MKILSVFRWKWEENYFFYVQQLFFVILCLFICIYLHNLCCFCCWNFYNNLLLLFLSLYVCIYIHVRIPPVLISEFLAFVCCSHFCGIIMFNCGNFHAFVFFVWYWCFYYCFCSLFCRPLKTFNHQKSN